MRLKKKFKAIALITSLFILLSPALPVFGAEANGTLKGTELVISTLNQNGEIADIQVLTHLQGIGQGTVSVNDSLKYKISSLRNLYGSEKLNLQDSQLSTQLTIDPTKGHSDLYYLAQIADPKEAESKLPVRVKVKYYLDGVEMTPAQIAGKSGKLKIVTELENLTGETKTLEYVNDQGETIKTDALIYTPYVVSLSGWEFDNKIFRNVSAPGVTGESPEGVIVDNQGITTINWTVPLIPPSYPARQYTTLEAEGVNITLPSLKIVVIPIVPVTSSNDTLGSVQSSLAQLYNAFDAIEKGIGTATQEDTILFGLNSLKTGLGELGGGINSLTQNIKALKAGISNSSFNLATYDSAKGTDAAGNKPGVKEAILLSKAAIDSQLLPAFDGQLQVLTGLEGVVGKATTTPAEPSATTSLYNDAVYLKALLGKLLAESPYAGAVDGIITNAMLTKIGVLSNNLTVLKSGGNLITSTGTTPFPAGVSTVQQGAKTLSASLGQTSAGIDQILTGIGPVDAYGQPVKVVVNGKPATILYALSYFNSSINEAVIPGIDKLIAGSQKIGEGSSQAKAAITSGLNQMQAAPAIVSALESNLESSGRFLGESNSIEGTPTYVFQTPVIVVEDHSLYYGLGVIVVALLVLIAFGRKPSKAAPNTDVKLNA